MNRNPIYLSVVLSTYNEEKFIAKSIQSILDQTYQFFEFIIVNDGSTDKTSQIIRSFDDHRIIIIDKPNSGLPDSLNMGINAANYEWIVRMDGDDVAEPTRLETQVKYINNHVGVIGGQFISIDEDGYAISGVASKKPLSYNRCKRWLLFGMSPLAHPTVFIRKSILERFGGYDINFSAAQDVELWCRLSPDIEIINIPETVLHYRIHNNNITTKRKNLQRMLTFIGFLKFVLRIRRPLNIEEFSKFKAYFLCNGLIKRNEVYFEWAHKGKGVLRQARLTCYYSWRLVLVVKYRLFRAATLNRIFA